LRTFYMMSFVSLFILYLRMFSKGLFLQRLADLYEGFLAFNDIGLFSDYNSVVSVCV